jgi:hypothetical protein
MTFSSAAAHVEELIDRENQHEAGFRQVEIRKRCGNHDESSQHAGDSLM